MAIYFLLPIVIVVLDQLAKAWASGTLQAVGTMPLIEGVFHLTYAENTGAAFSMLEGGRVIFLVITPVAIGALLWLVKINYFPTRLAKLAVFSIIGGAVGNFIDRLRMGYVVDMFDFRLINFAIFNVADIALTVGVALLFISILTMKEPQKEAKSDDSPPADRPGQ